MEHCRRRESAMAAKAQGPCLHFARALDDLALGISELLLDADDGCARFARSVPAFGKIILL